MFGVSASTMESDGPGNAPFVIRNSASTGSMGAGPPAPARPLALGKASSSSMGAAVAIVMGALVPGTTGWLGRSETVEAGAGFSGGGAGFAPMISGGSGVSNSNSTPQWGHAFQPRSTRPWQEGHSYSSRSGSVTPIAFSR